MPYANPQGQVQFSGAGGYPSYAWVVSAGAIPAGLTLDGTGLLSGTPTTLGTFTFTVRVTDKTGTFTDEPGSITVN